MHCLGIFTPNIMRKLSRPLTFSRVPAESPSPADYIKGSIDLNRDLIKHQRAPFTFAALAIRWKP
jgi:hypothetical protein